MKTLVKRDWEHRTYTFQFQYETEIAAGDTIASVTSITSDTGSNDGALPTLAIGQIVNSSRDVTSVISGGETGNTYLLKCRIVTTAGSKLQREGRLEVTDD